MQVLHTKLLGGWGLAVFSFSAILTQIPAKIPAKKEAIGLTIANNGPSNEYVASTESTPVVGVETRNETVALLLAPSLFKCAATGITPQEQSGKGIPKREAFITEEILFLEKC